MPRRYLKFNIVVVFANGNNESYWLAQDFRYRVEGLEAQGTSTALAFKPVRVL
jgi:hypothetical protein